MQTFLPYQSFTESAKVLDYKRLGKQRSEALIVYRTINNPNAKAWRNHPCTIMWNAYPEALVLYYNTILKEWIDRKYKNTMSFLSINQNKLKYPFWLGEETFHASHRAALLYKDYEWYKQFGWRERPKLSYVWPTYEKTDNFLLNKE